MRKKLHTIYMWLRKHISSVAFATGFLWDTVTLTRIDLLYENIVFTTYLVVAFVGILLVHGVETKKWTWPLLVRAKPWLPAIVQFPLGGLFSGFLIFYTKSASFFTSWPFIAILITLFFGNEFLRRRYERLIFQISFFYFALICYLVLLVPTLLGTIGTPTFMLALIVSLVLMILLLKLVMKLFPDVYRRSIKVLRLVLGGVVMGFAIMYFANTIPPVPLALQEIGIYHSAVRTSTGYELQYEPPPWYVFWRTTNTSYHRTKYEAAYCYTSVFAPTRLRTKIFHSWERIGEDGKWKEQSRIPYTIEGGRDGGYRGYTIKTSLPTGDWRCVVETEDGKTIGETRFTVIGVVDAWEQVTEVR